MEKVAQGKAGGTTIWAFVPSALILVTVAAMAVEGMLGFGTK
jgi:hypothetical protein